MTSGAGRKHMYFWVACGLVAAAGISAGLYLLVLKGPSVEAAEASGSPPAARDGADAVAHASKDGQDAGTAGGEDQKEAEGKEQNGKKAPVPVNVSAVRLGTVSSYISATANLVSESEVKVLAEAEGRVAGLSVEEGHGIRKGQVLATLVRDDAEIALRKAELRSTNARLAHERGVAALSEDLLSREDYDTLTMEKDLAEQELAEARWRLDKTSIRTPFSGLVTERIIQVGQHVRPGDHLFTVADFDPLIARIYLPERDVFGLKEGRDVRITLKADDSTSFRGRVRQISPVVDTATGTVKVTIEATSPPEEVRPGAFVTIDIVRETRPSALLVPREAVIRELQDSYVFIAKGDQAEKRIVSVGIEEGNEIQALSGVEAGDQVIVAGQGGLKDGSPIKIISTNEASTLETASDRPKHG